MSDIQKPTEEELRVNAAAKQADPEAYLADQRHPEPYVRAYYAPPVPAVKQSRDRAQYVRQQKGHSFILHWCILGVFSVFIVPIYYSVSPNHYWHI